MTSDEILSKIHGKGITLDYLTELIKETGKLISQRNKLLKKMRLKLKRTLKQELGIPSIHDVWYAGDKYSESIYYELFKYIIKQDIDTIHRKEEDLKSFLYHDDFLEMDSFPDIKDLDDPFLLHYYNNLGHIFNKGKYFNGIELIKSVIPAPKANVKKGEKQRKAFIDFIHRYWKFSKTQ